MRIFLDANVLFSASNATSSIAQLISQIQTEHELVTSDVALEEARRNILAKRSKWKQAFTELSKSMIVVPTRTMKLPVKLVDKDAPILSSAIKSQCDYFVTGDKKHFGHLYGQVVEGVEVVSLIRIAEILFDPDR